MDAFEATQIVNGEAATNNAEDEVQVGCLKIGSASHAIYKGFTRIGRTPPCRVILEDATVSRVHAEIQADVGNAFVSDLRSSNGTRMKEISLKPFFYYEIKEGGVIYFGQVRAEYTTKVKNSEPDDFVVPETPVVSKYRRGSENLPRNSGIGSIAESSVDESSMYDSDVSLIPGTQEVANKRRRSEEPTRMISETPESSTRDGVARVADIHEMETQNDVEFSCEPGPSKRSRWQRIRRNDLPGDETRAMPLKIVDRSEPKKSPVSDDIFEAETQAMPTKIFNRKVSKKSQNQNDIFEAETQAFPVARVEPDSEKSANDDDIFEAETQAMEISSPKSAKNGSKFNKINIHEAETQAIGISSPKSTQKVSKFSTKNIYDAETQAIEISSPKSAKNGSKFNKINIHEAETQAMEISSPKSTQKVSKCGTKNIYDAETQAMEISSPKSMKKVSKFSTKNIYDAETQAMAISSGSRKSVEKETDNIYEMATQVVSVSLRNEEDRLANDTAESSLRSNFSRDRLRLSSTPPGSPDNPDESQNLLEIVETPLLAYENIAEKKSSQEHRRRSENEEAQSLEKKSPRPRPVRIIPESSESETDDESATTRVARRRSKPSHVIEDSSDETDEENIFAASALRKKIPEKSTAAKEEAIGKLEVKRIRGSPLRLRQKPKAVSENVLSGEASSGEKSLARTGDSPMETKEETPMKKSNETLRKRLGNSPLSLSREKKGDSTTIDRVEIVRQAKANLFGDWAQENDEPTTKNRDENSRNFEGSPTKNDDSMKNRRDSQSKRFDSPTIIFHNGEDLSIEKDDENSTNEFDDSTSTKSRGETSKKSKNEGTEWENLKKRAETSEESMNKKDISKKSTNDEKSSKISKNQGSNKFENSPEKDDGPLKNRGESSEEKKIARLSLRRARKSDDDSPKKIDEGIGRDSTETERSGDSASRKDSSTVDRGKKAFDENHDNIFEAATQRMNPANCERRTGGESRDLEAKTIVDDDIDIDLLPTQIVDLPSSTPFSRRARVGKSVARREFDGDDLHSAPTQIPRNVESPKNVSGVDDDEKKIVERGEKKRTEKTIDLDDSLAINLGNLLGEEANDENFDDDADETQLMTQNLVDILRPTQSFNETEQRGRKSSPGANETEQRGRKSSPGANETEQRGKKSSPANENLVGQGTFESPLRKRTYAPVTLGFVDGEARERGEFDSPKKSKADENIVQPDQNRKTFEPDASDAKSGSSGESRKSSRARKPARKASPTTTRVEAKQQRSSEESQEIEAILGSSTGENLSATTRTSCVKVQLTRLDDSGAKEELGKVGDVFERPKVTRTRRTTSATRKEAAAPLPSPAKRARRTIAETPGIPGNNQIEHKVMFTGIAADGYCKIVEKLGGAVVSEPSKATVLITDKVRRTYKFLCAVAHGMRVVSINWLLESNKASSFLDSDGFTLREPAAEAKYKFNLANSLRIARTKKFLEGYTIVVTPKVNQPEVRELKAMVEAAGGRLLVRPPGPRGWNAKTVIVSREEDYAVAKTYLAKVPKSLNVTVQSTEFILTGILRQEVNLVEHKLDFT